MQRCTLRDNDDAVCVWSGAIDLGRGSYGSAGGNAFVGHAPGSGSWAVYNGAPPDVMALGTDWGQATSAAVEGVLYDRLDDPAAGRVRWWTPSLLRPPEL